jgi:predicted oxidoreductase (fatty acid repression mutant protein)
MHDKGGFSMGILESIGKRRTYYQINKELPVAVEKIRKVVEQATELTPDAFNMKSARVVLALGAKQDALWDAVYDAFGGKVAREKIDGFKAGAGTVLYFYDEEVIKSLQSQFPMYAENFPTWAQQANGMLQFAIWTALRDLDVGANIQHYNPVIDKAVQDLFDLPASWKLIAQMPFGGIVAEPEPKEQEDIAIRVQVQV